MTAFFTSLHAIEKKHELLAPLQPLLVNASDEKEKLNILIEHSFKSPFYKKNTKHFHSLPIPLQIVFESLCVIGQEDKIFNGIDSFIEHKEQITAFLKSLLPIEDFYSAIGGIVGYHIKFLELLIEKESYCNIPPKNIKRPPGFDLREDSQEVKNAVRAGIETLNEIAEIYPVAGAADRLDLKHTKTQEPLPAALLEFLGYPLLEGLIRDVEGREYLAFKLGKTQVEIPIILMTSNEKNNYEHLLALLNKNNWYNRSKNSFFFVHQPLVPVIQSDGQWAVCGTLDITLKPGGHGVLWKLLENQGALKWLKNQQIQKVIIRQINNPLAGIDHGLLALSGIGCSHEKAFGFASCERHLNSEEGMDVLIEKATPDGYSYTITNIEYTDFAKQGIQDVPAEQGSPFSQFPANTNILFADLEKIEEAIKKTPYPGMMINLKTKFNGILAGRIETTMQNIADALAITFPSQLKEEKKTNLPSFVTYNDRKKTIAGIKRAYQKGGTLRDTPEEALIELLKNSRELLESCSFHVPSSFLFTYHPSLGPLYQVIQQKIRKGFLHENAELKLEIGEIQLENLELDGSLIVFANCMQTGKCILKNIKVLNKGIDLLKPSIFWKYQIHRLESLKITIQENGEFIAEGVEFKGNYDLVVPPNSRMRAIQNGENIKFIIEPITFPSWEWKYFFNENNDIILRL